MPSKHALTMISVHPVTFLTILGLASDRLTMNSRALSLNVDRSSRSSSSSMDSGVGSGSFSSAVGGGNTKAPCRPPPDGKGLPTVGVGPQSTAGRISDGRKPRSVWRCGEKRMGCDEQSGVRVDRKVDR